MKFGYQFSNLCGTVYKKGNIIFTPDGNTLLSPVGNRITAFDLVNNTSITFPFENRQRIQTIAISPDSSILISIDEEGHTLLVNYYRRVVLSRFNFKEKVKVISFSKSGKYFAVGVGRFVQVWNTPGLQREFAPFLMVRKITGHFDDITSIEWSSDDKYILSGSKDLTVRIDALHDKEFVPMTFSGHKDTIFGAFFGKTSREVYYVSRDGALFTWEFIPNESASDSDPTDISIKVGKWSLKSKNFFLQNSKVSSCSIHHRVGTLLVVGFNNGVFGLYDLPEFTTVHTLSISSRKITACTINKTGEWLGFACAQKGQLLVWEWKSETYVMKQQGHALDMNCLAYSPDGQLIATGADDGKVKVWNTTTGFCFVTFTEHTGIVSAIAYSPTGNAIISASYDGTVRAYDLIRYRNFRTMTSPNPTSFTALAVDPSGDIICSSSRDTFEIFIWSLQTGRLLDVLGGHEGPVSSLAFNPLQPMLASCSWDKTVRLWEIYESKPARETLNHGTEVLAIAFRPDGKELCSSTLDGQLQFWDIENASINGTIEGKKDIMGGRKSTDIRTAKNNADTKHFTSVHYSADGSCVIAGGKSKFICFYEISQKILLKKFQISYNRSLDGVFDFLNSKYYRCRPHGPDR